MIEFEGLSKTYAGQARPALQGLHLEVGKGEIVGLVGLNGAGKTTMIRTAAGILLPTRGTVRLDGHDIVTDKIAASSTVGWVPEFPNFDPGARAADELEYLAGYNGVRGKQALPWALSVLGQVGLKGSEWQRIGTYSQGMKKRFALAAALVARPTNFLFDELLNGLDPEGIRYARTLLIDLRKQGASILLSSHILGEVEHLADRVAIIHEGVLLQVISPQDLHASRRRRLRVSVEGPPDGVPGYLARWGRVEQEGGAFVVDEPSKEAWEINADLVGMGLRVSELRMEREDLESYFFRRIQGRREP